MITTQADCNSAAAQFFSDSSSEDDSSADYPVGCYYGDNNKVYLNDGPNDDFTGSSNDKTCDDRHCLCKYSTTRLYHGSGLSLGGGGNGGFGGGGSADSDGGGGGGGYSGGGGGADDDGGGAASKK